MARDVVSKIIAIWWPIFIFVMLGMDHGTFSTTSQRCNFLQRIEKRSTSTRS